MSFQDYGSNSSRRVRGRHSESHTPSESSFHKRQYPICDRHHSTGDLMLPKYPPSSSRSRSRSRSCKHDNTSPLPKEGMPRGVSDRKVDYRESRTSLSPPSKRRSSSKPRRSSSNRKMSPHEEYDRRSRHHEKEYGSCEEYTESSSDEFEDRRSPSRHRRSTSSRHRRDSSSSKKPSSSSKRRNSSSKDQKRAIETSSTRRHSSSTIETISFKSKSPRPRLSLNCPVTKRNLVDDPSVMSDQTYKDSKYEDDDDDEEDILSVPPVQRKTNSSKSQSRFANLTSELVQYQKLVAELESMLQAAAASPEAQWRTRIALRSAQEADQDLSAKLMNFQAASYYDHEEPREVARVQGASRKLQRDFQRVHKTYETLVETYNRQQQADLSYLMNNNGGDEKKQKEEEYFDRAMREREEEVKKINQSMNRVNEIYQDLAALVEGQQEQIDKIGEAAEESKARTMSGLEHIQQGIMALCGPTEASIDSDIRESQRSEGKATGHNSPSLKDIFKLVEDAQALLHERLLESGCHSALACEEGESVMQQSYSYATTRQESESFSRPSYSYTSSQ